DLFEHGHEFEDGHVLKFGFNIRDFGKRFQLLDDVAALLLHQLSLLHLVECFHNGLVLLVFEEMLYKFFARIDLIALLVNLRSWQKHPRFDAHQGSGDKNKFACDLNVEGFHVMHIREEVFRYLRDRDIVDIKFIALDKEEQQVKRALKQG